MIRAAFHALLLIVGAPAAAVITYTGSMGLAALIVEAGRTLRFLPLLLVVACASPCVLDSEVGPGACAVMDFARGGE